MGKVLVVDDSSVMRKIIIQTLASIDIQKENVLEAGDGKDAVDIAGKESLSLILMDWNMPGMLGIDAVENIRKSGNATPIIMVTTEGEKANVVRAIQAGANNYVIKPFEPTSLIEKIEPFLN